MHNNQSVCPFCDGQFVRVKSQVYCSLHCALWSRIDIKGVDDCWLWTAGTDAKGYGCFTFNNQFHKSSRTVLVEAVGNSYLDALHSCDTPACCNPKHLRWGTHSENMQDMISRNRRIPQRGERGPRAILTNDQVVEIKKLLGFIRQVDIAEHYDVKRSVIADISANRSYLEV